jgi:hypothetical protein
MLVSHEVALAGAAGAYDKIEQADGEPGIWRRL